MSEGGQSHDAFAQAARADCTTRQVWLDPPARALGGMPLPPPIVRAPPPEQAGDTIIPPPEAGTIAFRLVQAACGEAAPGAGP
ncbi:hypothetical protein [Allosphingosinicella deserti]|uniref:Uncharacterized protein n=1 Tax=Allosphingosinicella deserti TaxID=2116704 RepID=A0A2P7QR37_9SPHN|nr:hypothetical protein [Sphingomonas deserti]PSJ40433.1 hypothetical protein C7I55_08835 [Sphingomonas deserti]